MLFYVDVRINKLLDLAVNLLISTVFEKLWLVGSKFQIQRQKIYANENAEKYRNAGGYVFNVSHIIFLSSAADFAAGGPGSKAAGKQTQRAFRIWVCRECRKRDS